MIYTKYLLKIAFVVFLLCSCGEKYSVQGHRLSKEIYKTLIDYGYCENQNDCSSKEIVYGEHGDKVRINIYGIQDRNLISKIISTVSENGLSKTEGVPIEVRFYKEKKLLLVKERKSPTLLQKIEVKE